VELRIGDFSMLTGRSITVLPLVLMASMPLAAEELNGDEASAEFTNIGFLNPSPDALKKRFPMCDAFLKVVWIDKQKKIGYTRYDLYHEGKKDGRWLALVHLDPASPRADYYLDGYRKAGTLQEFFSAIKQGQTAFYRANLVIEVPQKDRTVVAWELTTISEEREVWDYTLADNRKNVCVPYPGGQRMWIAERRMVKKLYGSDEAARKLDNLTGLIQGKGVTLSERLFLSLTPVDLNFDGIEDYVGLPSSIIYSHGGNYYQMQVGGDLVDKQLSFPPTANVCGPKPYLMNTYLTTDGKSYFLNNECNLTEATK